MSTRITGHRTAKTAKPHGQGSPRPRSEKAGAKTVWNEVRNHLLAVQSHEMKGVGREVQPKKIVSSNNEQTQNA